MILILLRSKSLGKTELLKNYIPTSVLSYFSKISKRAMYNQLYKYQGENNLLFQKQFGFWGLSTTDQALVELMRNVCDFFNQNKYTLRA